MSRIREIENKGDNENNVTFHYASDADYKEFCIKKKSKGRPLSLLDYNLNQAYPTALSIDPLKLKDLLTLCNLGVIPSTRHAFYQFLFAANKDNSAGTSNKDE